MMRPRPHAAGTGLSGRVALAWSEIDDEAVLLAAVDDDFLLPALEQTDLYTQRTEAVMTDQLVEQ